MVRDHILLQIRAELPHDADVTVAPLSSRRTSLSRGGKLFCAIEGDDLHLKLSAVRVERLLQDRVGRRCRPSPDRSDWEWITVSIKDPQGICLVGEKHMLLQDPWSSWASKWAKFSDSQLGSWLAPRRLSGRCSPAPRGFASLALQRVVSGRGQPCGWANARSHAGLCVQESSKGTFGKACRAESAWAHLKSRSCRAKPDDLAAGE